MDANTTRDVDATELAALYQAAEDAGKAFYAHSEAGAVLFGELQAARGARDNFKRDFKAKHMGLKVTNRYTTNAE